MSVVGFNYFSNNKLVVGFNKIGFERRWPAIFKDYREYEQIHIFFWLGKEYVALP